MRNSTSSFLSLALILLLLALVASCESSNVGGGLNFAPTIHSATYNPATRLLTVIASDRDGDELTVSVTEPPGWAVANNSIVVAGGSGKAVFSWTPPGASSTHTTTISVTDGIIPQPLTTTCELTVSVSPPPPPPPPVITSVTFTNSILTVSVTDANAVDVQVSVTVPTGLAVDHTTQTVAGGNGNAVFVWSTANPSMGGIGTTTISAVNGLSDTPAINTAQITFPPGNVAPEIVAAVFAEPTLTVQVSDANGDDLTVSVTEPAGWIADAAIKEVAGGSGTVTFTWSGAGAGETTVSVSDGIAPPVTKTVTIGYIYVDQPVIEDAVWLDNGDGSGTLSVDVGNLFGADLLLSVTTPAGASVDAAQQTFPGAQTVHAVFTYTESTPGAGASGVVVISADNGFLPPTTRNVQITISPQTFQPWPLDPDTLYARPEKTTVAVGEAVTIYVYTGQPAHPLQFLSSVGFTVETAGTYVAGSFNIGAAGGGRTTTDGYWALMTNPVIPDDNYLDLPSKIPGAPTDIGGGFQRYSFGVVPMGPSVAPATVGTGTGPILFNFQLTFSTAGMYHLGFQLSDGTFDQTYYSDADGNNYFWSVLDHSNTITVQ